METPRRIACAEVWGGIGASDAPVVLPGLEGHCWSRPYRGADRGGDIHFLSACGENRLGKAVIADVSGHGDAAAAVSSALHEGLHESMNEPDNVGLLAAVNARLLARQDDELRFSTMVSLIFDRMERTLVYAYAGHPSLLWAGRDGRFRPLVPAGAPRGGAPVGILREVAYQEHRAVAEPGDLLVMYTDAFSEARTPEGMLGEDGLVAMLESAPDRSPGGLVRHVVGALEDRLDDDASLLVLRVS